jgi:MFS family permease
MHVAVKLAGPWRQPDFVKLWLGVLVSGVGSQVTLLALPLTAILVLDARPAEVALLTTFGFAPSLLFSLLVGVWTDRLRRRWILLTCDIGRGLLVLSVPIAAWPGVLGEWLGLRATIAIAAVGTTLGMATLLVSPVRTVRELPALAPEEAREPRPPHAGSHRPSATTLGSLPLRP